MGAVLKALLHSFIWIMFVGLIGAALVKLDVSLPLRLLLFTGGVAVYFMFRDLHIAITQLYETQMKLLYWLRTTYIATEMTRLEPENRKPAQDILANDLKEERQYKDAHDSLKRDSLFSPWGILFGGTWAAFVLLHIIGPFIVCGLVVYFWEDLIVLLP